LPVASGAKLQLKIGTTMTATTALSVTDDRVNALTNGTHVTYSIYQPTETTGLFATDESLTPTEIAAAKAANPGTTAYNKYYTGGLVINPSTGVITGQPNKGSGGSVKIVATGKNSTS
jgi:hypothetical protein